MVFIEHKCLALVKSSGVNGWPTSNVCRLVTLPYVLRPARSTGSVASLVILREVAGSSRCAPYFLTLIFLPVALYALMFTGLVL